MESKSVRLEHLTSILQIYNGENGTTTEILA